MARAEVFVEGFVAKDPESRAAGNHTITTVTVPVKQEKRDREGKWVADTDRDGKEIVVWWEAEFWNEYGDVVASTIRKGDLVQVRGDARPRAFSKNDGTAGLAATIVNATVAKVVRRPSRNAQHGSGASGGSGAGQRSPEPQNGVQGGFQGGGFDAPEEPF